MSPFISNFLFFAAEIHVKIEIETTRTFQGNSIYFFM